jgi:hypothetical protein
MVTVVYGCMIDLDRDVLFCVWFLVAGEELYVWGGRLGETGWRWCDTNSLEFKDEWEDGRKKFDQHRSSETRPAASSLVLSYACSQEFRIRFRFSVKCFC